MRNAAIYAIFAFLFIFAAMTVGHALVNTGPNCPGMSPEWLGWCE